MACSSRGLREDTTAILSFEQAPASRVFTFGIRKLETENPATGSPDFDVLGKRPSIRCNETNQNVARALAIRVPPPSWPIRNTGVNATPRLLACPRETRARAIFSS
jgi:hypothetical protein